MFSNYIKFHFTTWQAKLSGFKNKKMEIRILFCLLLALTSNIGCDKKNYCTGGVQIEDVLLSFQLIDVNGSSVIGNYWKKYDTKYVKFLNSLGEPPDGTILYGDGTIFFNLVQPNQYSKDTIANEYYLILPPVAAFPFEDIDTINVVAILQRFSDCEYPILNQILVSYNDSLYYSNSRLPNSLDFYKL